MTNREYSLTLHNNIERDIFIRPCIEIGAFGQGGIIEYTSKLGNKVKIEPYPYGTNYSSNNKITKPFEINIDKEVIDTTNVSLGLIYSTNYNDNQYIQPINLYKESELLISGTNPAINLYKKLKYNGGNHYANAGEKYKLTINEDEYTPIVENITELDMTGCDIVNLNPLCEELVIDGNKLVQSGGNYGTYEYVDTDNQTVSGTIDGYDILSSILGYCQNNNIKVTLEFNINNQNGFKLVSSSVMCKTKKMTKILDNGDIVVVQTSPQYTLQSYDTEIDYRLISGEGGGTHILAKGSSYTLYMIGVKPNSRVDIYKDNQLIDNEVYGRIDLILN